MRVHVRVDLRRAQLGLELTHSLHHVERAIQVDLEQVGTQVVEG